MRISSLKIPLPTYMGKTSRPSEIISTKTFLHVPLKYLAYQNSYDQYNASYLNPCGICIIYIVYYIKKKHKSVMVIITLS